MWSWTCPPAITRCWTLWNGCGWSRGNRPIWKFWSITRLNFWKSVSRNCRMSASSTPWLGNCRKSTRQMCGVWRPLRGWWGWKFGRKRFPSPCPGSSTSPTARIAATWWRMPPQTANWAVFWRETDSFQRRRSCRTPRLNCWISERSGRNTGKQRAAYTQASAMWNRTKMCAMPVKPWISNPGNRHTPSCSTWRRSP